MKINNTEYQEINAAIINELKDRESDIYEIISKIKTYHEEKILDAIRWMLDNNIIVQNNNGRIKLK